MITLSDAMTTILDIFPDATVEEIGGEVVIYTHMKSISSDEHLVSIDEEE